MAIDNQKPFTLRVWGKPHKDASRARKLAKRAQKVMKMWRFIPRKVYDCDEIVNDLLSSGFSLSYVRSFFNFLNHRLHGINCIGSCEKAGSEECIMTSNGSLPIFPICFPMKKVCFPNHFCTKKLSFSPVIFYLLRDDFVENYVKSATQCGRIKEFYELKQFKDKRNEKRHQMQKYIRREI
ncbi:MAG: hypothetical protein ACTSP4_02775 [Candidatus Hodarchaeales archaeon]